ncbi:MAG: hypothetical protein ACJ8I9_00530 [Chthoniobacterales bacterium]|jgi:hypothetical protein
MKRAVAIALLFIVANLFAAETDDQTRARKTALDVAGAFSNDGFKMRDGHWSGTVTPQERTIVAVNLYAGNQYWFSAASADESKKVSVEVFDENGRQLSADNYNAGPAAAAGVSAANSGQYFVSLSVEGAPTTCCLLYSYK